jgi:serine/threonine protein kinase
MNGGALLSQGGYGCVFSPSINCDGKESSKKYISKIQKNDFSADNEIRIGETISKNKDSYEYFAPVIKSCPIDISEIKTEGLDDCKIITSQRKIQKFLMMKIRFINGSILSSFITENKNSSLIFSSFVNIYQHLLKGLQILVKERIVHFDLKGPNIVYNNETEKPIIIDFGLSIPIDELIKSEQYYRYFYIYAPDYYIWPLEVHFLNYIENVDEEPTLETIEHLSKEFVKKNSAINKLSESFQNKYIESSISELKKYLNKPAKHVKRLILKSWKTWDNYSISVMYLKYIETLFGNDRGLSTNHYVKFMIQTLLQNIHPNPEKRIHIDTNVKMMNDFFNNKKIIHLDNFESLIREISINKSTIVKQTIANSKKMTRLTRKILNRDHQKN